MSLTHDVSGAVDAVFGERRVPSDVVSSPFDRTREVMNWQVILQARD